MILIYFDIRLTLFWYTYNFCFRKPRIQNQESESKNRLKLGEHHQIYFAREKNTVYRVATVRAVSANTFDAYYVAMYPPKFAKMGNTSTLNWKMGHKKLLFDEHPNRPHPLVNWPLLRCKKYICLKRISEKFVPDMQKRGNRADQSLRGRAHIT